MKQLKEIDELELIAKGDLGGSKVSTVVEAAAHGRWTRSHARLRRTYLRLHAKAERAGKEPGANIAEDGVKTEGGVRPATTPELERSVRVMRRMLGLGDAQSGGSGGAASPQLAAIAACESGGNPRAVGGGGLYRGKYQFSRGTWASVGGTGDPAAAPEAEQDRRAAMLLARSGPGHWPNCA
jgi:Transglycosylase-like domain